MLTPSTIRIINWGLQLSLSLFNLASRLNWQNCRYNWDMWATVQNDREYSINYVCITNNQPETNPILTPSPKQHAIVNIRLKTVSHVSYVSREVHARRCYLHRFHYTFRWHCHSLSLSLSVSRTMAPTPWGTGAPWVEEQQARNWPNCTDHHESVHPND